MDVGGEKKAASEKWSPSGDGWPILGTRECALSALHTLAGFDLHKNP